MNKILLILLMLYNKNNFHVSQTRIKKTEMDITLQQFHAFVCNAKGSYMFWWKELCILKHILHFCSIEALEPSRPCVILPLAIACDQIMTVILFVIVILLYCYIVRYCVLYVTEI